MAAWIWNNSFSRLLAAGALPLVLSGCGQDDFERAIKCDQFQRRPDGRWVAVKDASITTKRWGIGNYQLNYGRGSTIKGTGTSEGARLIAALDKVCR